MYKPVELFIGLRYTRAKRRNHFISFISLTSMLGIMLGITALITVLSVMNGFHKEVRERILGMASHATVFTWKDGIPDWREVMERVGEHPRVIGMAPFVEVQGMLVNGNDVSGALIRGILPEEEPAVSDVLDHLVYGQGVPLEAGRFRIILGKELAYALGAGPGDKVTLVTPQTTVTPAGTLPRLKRFTVTGVFEVGMGEYDRSVALIHMDDAARLLRMGDSVSGIRLRLDDLYEAPRVVGEIADWLPGRFRLSDWTMEHRNFFSALRIEKRMMGIILFLIVAVAAFNIVSTLVMVVTDKRSDIATLRTFGATSATIMGIFIVQGATIGVIGTLLGVAGGILLAVNVEPIVRVIEQLFGVHFLDPSIYYISELPSEVHWNDVWLIGASALVISLLATLYPARRAAATDPAEALRYE
ncbi:MAG: lipoprotein-releasing ABC transporter permease subunit [Chromatiales bacterium]|jgi:lipoprotein-releasing system permease protein